MERYDRQLRLWGTVGQDSLNRSRVCVVGPATPLLQEVSKNLVLAGISSLTWLKEKCAVQSSPLFLADLKKDLMTMASSQLEFEENDLRSTLQQLQYDWTRFSVVILTCLGKHSTLLDLNEVRRQRGAKFPPVLSAFVSGFYGYMNLVLSETHFVLRAHPESKRYDLRLQNPWPELVNYVDTFDLSRMDLATFSGIPYIILLIKCVAKLKKDGNNEEITTHQVKDALNQLCLPVGNDVLYEPNYIEARRYAYLACPQNDSSKELEHLLRNLKVSYYGHDWFDTCNQDIHTLLFTLKSISEESEEFGFQPLTGSLPDMESTTENYIKLKNLYEMKAKLDRFRIEKGLTRSKKKVSKDVLGTFCSHYGEIRRILPTKNDLLGIFSTSNTLLNALMMVQFYGELAGVTESKDEFIGLRVDGNYSVMAFFGGAVAQEAIKLITHHYVPIDNLFLYNGVDNSSATYRI